MLGQFNDQFNSQSDQLEANSAHEIAQLLRANLEKSEEVLKVSQDIKNYMRWQNIWSIVRLLVIIIPIIIGIIYLPPLIKNYIQQYQDLYKNLR